MATLSWPIVSLSLSVTAPSLSVSWSTVTASGAPISSSLLYLLPIAPEWSRNASKSPLSRSKTSSAFSRRPSFLTSDRTPTWTGARYGLIDRTVRSFSLSSRRPCSSMAYRLRSIPIDISKTCGRTFSSPSITSNFSPLLAACPDRSCPDR